MFASWFFLIAQYFAGVDTLQSAVRAAVGPDISTPACKQADRIQVVSSDPKVICFAGLNRIQVSTHRQCVD